MLLYHFTSRENLSQIATTGLSRGMVPVSPTEARNGVWLTTDPGPGGHGLENGGKIMTELDRQQALDWTGVLPLPGTRFPKQGPVRITVDLPTSDRNLHEWLPWARQNLSPEWLAVLHSVALGNLIKAKTWRIYFGVIPPESFLAIDSEADHPTARSLRRA